MSSMCGGRRQTVTMAAVLGLGLWTAARAAELAPVALDFEGPAAAAWTATRWSGVTTWSAAGCPVLVSVEGGSAADQQAVTVAWDTQTRAGGARALRIDTSKVTSDAVRTLVWLPVPGPAAPATTCAARLAMRCEGGATRLDLVGLAGWADGQAIGAPGDQLTADNRWRTLEFALPTPAFTRATGQMWVVLAIPGTVRDQVWLDDVAISLGRGTSGTAGGPGRGIPQRLQYVPLNNPLGQRIDAALEKAKTYLVGLQQEDGSFPEYPEKLSADLAKIKGYTTGGQTAMVALALHELADPKDKDLRERVLKAGDWLAAQTRITSTYGVSWRCIALSGIDPERYKDTIKKDFDQLARSFRNGELDPVTKKPVYGWGYFEDPAKSEGLRTDNSNGQFALLALRDAALYARIEVPRTYWQVMERFWLGSQLPDGGWNYSIEDRWQTSYNNMVAAGLASLYICYDFNYGRGGAYTDFSSARPTLNAIAKGQAWINANFLNEDRMNRIPVGTKVNDYSGKEWTVEPGFYHFFYYCYGVYRIGQASGLRRFGEHDWFEKLATMLVNIQKNREESQKGKGEFTEELYNTAFATLFLARGKAPLIVHKLDIANDPVTLARDAANFTLWMSRQLERPLNWQRVDLGMTTAELLQAPVLFISATRLKLTDAEKDKLRAYVLEGGTILANNAGGTFTKDFEDLMLDILPEFPLAAMPADHPLLRCYRPVKPEGLKIASNGLRPLVIFATTNIGSAWHRFDAATNANAFNVGAAVVLSAVDLTGFRDKLNVVDLSDPPGAASKVKVGRLAHGGGYNAVPNLLEHLARTLQFYYKLGVDDKDGLKTAEPIPSDVVQLWITGCTATTLPPETARNLKAYVDGGGTVVFEAAGGSAAFNAVIEKLIKDALPDAKIVQLSADHPVLSGRFKTGVGFDVRKGLVTRAVNPGGSPVADPPPMWGVEYNGRLVGFWSKLDLSSGMANHQFLGNKGFKTETARGLSANLLLFALDAAAQR